MADDLPQPDEENVARGAAGVGARPDAATTSSGRRQPPEPHPETRKEDRLRRLQEGRRTKRERATRAEIAIRVEFVLRMRLQGAETYDLFQIVNKDGLPWPDGHGVAWLVNENTIRRYIQLADEKLVATLEQSRDKLISRHVASRRMLYNRALRANDQRTALSVLDSEAKLLALFPPPGGRALAPDAGPTATAAPVLDRFARDPVGYARDVLKVSPTPDQEAIARALLAPPHRVIVKAGHSVGKTFLGAWLVNWWYDTRTPSIAISTAPTQRDVCDLLWAEVRLQRSRAGLPNHFTGPAAPSMGDSDEHWAKGYTARKGESFQGRHREKMLFVFDESEGVEPTYWQTTKTMFQPGGDHAWLAIGNPTTTSSQAYIEESATGADGQPAWRVMSLSCLNHPNIAAELAGLPPVVPAAVRLAQVKDWVADWCQPLGDSLRRATDFEFPPGSGVWYRPGPLFEARVLGRRPTGGTDTVWSEGAFDQACGVGARPAPDDVPEIGCDVARFGDDWTAIHIRIGPQSVHHEAANGWPVDRVAGRLVELAGIWAEQYSLARPDRRPLKASEITIKVDDGGVGGGVLDILQSQRYRVVGVNAASAANDKSKYPRRRDELWFDVADRAGAGLVSFKLLPSAVVQRLRQQALAPKYSMDGMGRRVVERKEDTKERIGRSPDDMDAVNLAYAVVHGGQVEIVEGVTRSSRQ